MIGTSVRPSPAAPSISSRTTKLLLGAELALLALLSVALVGVVAVVSATPIGMTVGVPDGATDVPLTSDLKVALTGWATRLDAAALYESPLGPDGRPGPERPVALQADVTRASRMPDGTELSLRPASGTLNPDASYRLVVQASALAAQPWPGLTSVEREVRFTTLRSPMPRPLAGPVKLTWGQPLQISWSAPIDDVQYEVSPPTPIRTAIDPASRQVSTVILDDPADAETYRIRVVGARGANGIQLAQPAEYTAIAPPRPKLLDVADEPQTLEVGLPLTLHWSTPISQVTLETDPPLTTHWSVDRRDPTAVQVTFEGLDQDTSYALKVTEAVSRQGAPLAEPSTMTVKTPPKLMVEDLDTGSQGPRVEITAKPIVIFDQPIRDQKKATAALSVNPPIPGRWEWLDDHRVQFSPTRPWPYGAEITVNVRPGPDGARAVDGGYFERQAVLSFVTEEDKLIDVNVTSQVMTLYEKKVPVRTYKVATGVPGADTPSGEFNVEYKMPTARFVGTNVSGSHYDIPDVHWVLAFSGDYTIHGAYWRAAFGAPGSNGCVSLSDEEAKAVFDWAPEGTRIKIHY